jgi:hypothetical protein
MKAKLGDHVHVIEQVGVAVVPLIRTGSPRQELVRAAAAARTGGLVIGAYSQRAVFKLDGTAQAICQRAPAVVVMALPWQ